MGSFTEIHQDTDGTWAGMPEAMGQVARGGGRMWVGAAGALEKRRERAAAASEGPVETEVQCEV